MNIQPRLYQRGSRGTWWADFGDVGGIRHRRSLGVSNADKAQAVAAGIAAEFQRHIEAKRLATLVAVEPSASWRERVESEAGAAVLLKLWKNANSRAKRDGKVWALSWADLKTLVLASDGKCAVTGLAMRLQGAARDPYKVSLDRIDNTTGYSLGNCRMTLMAVNIAMNVWGQDTFKAIALAFAGNRLHDLAAQIPAQANSRCGTGT